MATAPSTFYADAHDENLGKKNEKEKLALNHFNFFLKTYCVQIGIKLVEAAAIPFHGLPRQKSNKKIFAWWSSLIGCFITYMGTNAKIKCDPKANRLAFGSADQYCSSVKVYFENKFRNEASIPVFQPDSWKKLKAKLRGMYREGNRASGKRMVQGKESSTREDREAMATGCIWHGTAETAEYWHLLNTSYHCSGRGSEVSLVTPEGTSVVEVNEDVYQYHVLQTNIQRQKDGPFQSIPIYPHRDGVLEDFYFSLIYLVVMVGCGNEYVFPTFSNAALKTKSGKSDSQVSTLWANLFDEVRNTFETLGDRINEKLSSHCNKKGSNQVMAETNSVSGLAQIFRTGWELRGCDTLFEYICGSFVMSQQCGKAVSKWTAKIGDLIIGGQPPTFNDMEGDLEELNQFTSVLFEDDTSGRWDPKVRELLVIALLLRYDQFCEVLRSHPEATLNVETHPGTLYDTDVTNSSLRNHLFVRRVEQAMEKAGVCEVMFGSWKRLASKAFLSRNIPGIPIEKFPLYGGGENAKKTLYGGANGNGILMDPRCFVDHFNALASVTQSINMKLQQQQHMINDIHRTLGAERAINNEYIIGKIYNMDRSMRRLENHLIGKVPKPDVTPSSQCVIPFSISSKAFTKQMTVTDATVQFFVDKHPAGLILDMKSDSWKDLDSTEKKRLRNLFNSTKRAVRMVLMHADSFPPTPDKQFKETLRRTATAAEERIRNDFGFGDKTISIWKLADHPMTKTLEKTLELPENTPEDIRKIFTT